MSPLLASCSNNQMVPVCCGHQGVRAEASAARPRGGVHRVGTRKRPPAPGGQRQRSQQPAAGWQWRSRAQGTGLFLASGSWDKTIKL
ncbi:hypothetical protein MRX96_015189 [Rhipicephalus microplus]